MLWRSYRVGKLKRKKKKQEKGQVGEGVSFAMLEFVCNIGEPTCIPNSVVVDLSKPAKLKSSEQHSEIQKCWHQGHVNRQESQ